MRYRRTDADHPLTVQNHRDGRWPGLKTSQFSINRGPRPPVAADLEPALLEPADDWLMQPLPYEYGRRPPGDERPTADATTLASDIVNHDGVE